MDVEGKHFPDEENEYEIKTGKKSKNRVGKIIFRFIALCSLAVYIICFARIFSSCDSSLLEKATFSDKAIELYNKDPSGFITYKINTKDFMEYYGTITISNVIYAETASEIEIGIKYNEKITETASASTDTKSEDSAASKDFGEYPLVYRLYDQKGNEYAVCNRINTAKGRYKFERVCFSDVKIDFSNNYLNVSAPEVSGEDVFFETEESKNREKYTLEIYNPVTNETHKFVIYDDQTSYRDCEFEPQ